MIDIFEFSDYRAVLSAQISLNASIRGYQARLAEAAGCKRSFLSQVLHSNVNLTPDHGIGLCDFWKLDEDQTDWFMELLAEARAGTIQMRKLCRRRLDALKKKRANLTERFKPSRLLSKEAQAEYYSSWYWAAIHIVTCIPTCQTVQQISSRLQLRDGLVHKTLISLEKMGLVIQKGKGWQVAESDLHVPKASKLNIANHVNWRQRAISDIQIGEEDSLHYTAVHALAVKDIPKIRREADICYSGTREIVKPSPEEEIVCLTCDLFRL